MNRVINGVNNNGNNNNNNYQFNEADEEDVLLRRQPFVSTIR